MINNKIDFPHSTSVQAGTNNSPLIFDFSATVSTSDPKVYQLTGANYFILDLGTVIQKEDWLSDTFFITSYPKRSVTSLEEIKSFSFANDTLYFLNVPEFQQVLFCSSSMLNKIVSITNCRSFGSALSLLDVQQLDSRISQNSEDIANNTDLILENVQAILQNSEDISQNSEDISKNKMNLLRKQIVNVYSQFFLSAVDESLSHLLPSSVSDDSAISQEFGYTYTVDTTEFEGAVAAELFVKGTGTLGFQLFLNGSAITDNKTFILDNADFNNVQISISDVFFSPQVGDILSLRIGLTSGMELRTGDPFNASVFQLIPVGSLARFWEVYGGDNVPISTEKVFSSQKTAELLALKQDKLFDRTLFFSGTNQLVLSPVGLVPANVNITSGTPATFSSGSATVASTIKAGQIVEFTIWLRSNNTTDKTYTLTLQKNTGVVLGSTALTVSLTTTERPVSFVLTTTADVPLAVGESLQVIIQNSSANTSTIISGTLTKVSYLTFQIASGSYNPSIDVFLPVGAPYYQIVGEHPEPAVLYPGTVWEKLYDGDAVTVRTNGTISAEGRGTDGIQGDAIRNIFGSVPFVFQSTANPPTGVFVRAFVGGTYAVTVNEVNDNRNNGFDFNASLVVPTSTENRMRNVLWNIWKRIA